MRIVSDSPLRDALISAHGLSLVLNPGIISALNLVQMNAGEYLLTQDSPLLNLYLLVDGKVRIEHSEPNGSHAVYAFVTAFSILGDLEIFSARQNKALCTVQAETDSLFLALPVDFIKKYAINDPSFLLFICRNLSEKLLNTSIMHSSGAISVESKLRKYLLLKTQSEGLIFRLENRESLAAMLGVSVRQLNRALLKLAEKRIIHFKHKAMEIIDLQELAKSPDERP